VTVWRWVALLLIAWAAPPLIARTARALSWREKRKKACPHLRTRVQEMLQAEFPEVTVDRPVTPFSWFTDPELSAALVTPTVFAYVVPEGEVRKKDLESVARYGGAVGAVDLRVYTHDPVSDPGEITVNDRAISVHGVHGCPCGRRRRVRRRSRQGCANGAYAGAGLRAVRRAYRKCVVAGR
jgi:hypothetical protein